MNQDTLNALFEAFAEAIAPHVVETVIDRLTTSGMLTTEVDNRIQAKMDDLTMHDKALIRNIVQDELENSDFSDKISDWMEINYDIADDVRDAVRDLSFTVTVD